MKKVLVIRASAHANGNSDRLAQEFTNGALASGNEVEIIDLRTKKIGHCLGCDYCRNHNGKCALQDDMKEVNQKMLSADVVGQRHYNVAKNVKMVMAQYEELKDIIAMLGYDELSDEDQATVIKARQLERFLTQPFATTKHFTGLEGKLVDLEQTLEGCERILSGEFLHLSPNAFYMIGDISEVKLDMNKTEENKVKSEEKKIEENQED